jgi:hypothetical protein
MGWEVPVVAFAPEYINFKVNLWIHREIYNSSYLSDPSLLTSEHNTKTYMLLFRPVYPERRKTLYMILDGWFWEEDLHRNLNL